MKVLRAMWLGLFGVLGAGAAQADSFYKDKQVKLVIGTAVGGSYDFSARMVGRHINRHIPDKPTLIVQNMPGAGGVIACNYLYNVAPQDGTALGAIVQINPLNYMFKDPGVRFDPAKFHWIGNPTSSVNLYAVWHTVPVKTVNEFLNTPVVFGSTTRTGSGGAEILLLNNILGTKFQLVTGYKGGSEIDLAIERGEVQGRAAQSLDGWKLTKPDWVRDGKIKVMIQMGLARDKELPDVPLLTEIAQTEEQKTILGLFSYSVGLGRPIIVGPDVPADRVQILREAFRKTMADPEYLEEAEKANVEVSAIYGEQLQEIVSRMLATPEAAVKKAKEAVSEP